jgi:trk system potassium uptake protein TrkH
VAKKQSDPLSPRQLRRQQQREAAALSAAAAPVQPISPASDTLGPSLLVPLFSFIIIVGYLLFARGFATRSGNELSHHQSLFTAINAATLTGFQQARNPDDYTVGGKVLTASLMISGMLFSFVCGGTAVVRIARLRFSSWHILAWSFGSIFLLAIGGGLAIKLCGGDAAVNRGFDEDVFQAISAYGNCGLTLGALPSLTSAAAILVLIPLSILGGLGLPVVMDVVDSARGKGKLSQYTWTVLIWTASSYLVITMILYLVRWPGVNASASFWRSAFVEASNQAINARSAGFGFQSVSVIPEAITFLLVIVMLIGASPAGSAGGLKLTTLAVLTRGTRDSLAGKPAGRLFGASLVWLLFFMGVLVLATVALLITDPEIPPDRTLFLAASALGNVGLSHNPVDASTAGLYVLSATMLLGRVAPVMMLWYVVDTIPEATVAVG